MTNATHTPAHTPASQEAAEAAIARASVDTPADWGVLLYNSTKDSGLDAAIRSLNAAKQDAKDAKTEGNDCFAPISSVTLDAAFQGVDVLETVIGVEGSNAEFTVKKLAQSFFPQLGKIVAYVIGLNAFQKSTHIAAIEAAIKSTKTKFKTREGVIRGLIAKTPSQDAVEALAVATAKAYGLKAADIRFIAAFIDDCVAGARKAAYLKDVQSLGKQGESLTAFQALTEAVRGKRWADIPALTEAAEAADKAAKIEAADKAAEAQEALDVVKMVAKRRA